MFALIISSTPNLSVMLQVKHFGQPVKYMIHVPDQIFQPQSMVVKRDLTNRANGIGVLVYTTHGTYSFTSHPKDEAIMVKCLAQGHKCHDRHSNPHSAANTRT